MARLHEIDVFGRVILEIDELIVADSPARCLYGKALGKAAINTERANEKRTLLQKRTRFNAFPPNFWFGRLCLQEKSPR
jgi:hypothetical protein